MSKPKQSFWAVERVKLLLEQLLEFPSVQEHSATLTANINSHIVMSVFPQLHFTTGADPLAFGLYLSRVVKGHGLKQMFPQDVHLGQLFRLIPVEPEPVAKSALIHGHISEFNGSHHFLTGRAQKSLHIVQFGKISPILSGSPKLYDLRTRMATILATL